MQKVFFILIAIIGYLYYDSTLSHHFLLNQKGNLLGKCTSSYQFLDLHVEAFNCKEDFETDVPYIIFNCLYKNDKYTLYEFNSFQECKVVSKNLKKDDEKINTKRKKIISTNFGVKRKSIFDGLMDTMSSAFEHDPGDIRYGIRQREEAAIKRIKPVENMGKDDPDRYQEDIDDSQDQDDGSPIDVEKIKDVNKRRLEIYKQKNGY